MTKNQEIEDLEQEDLSEQELSYWLAFAELIGSGVGSARIRLLYEQLGSLAAAWESSPKELKDIKGFNEQTITAFVEKRSQIHPEKLLSELQKTDIKAYPFAHPLYPVKLKQIYDPPLVLYVRGSITDHDFKKAAGVVGTRRPTAYGQRLAKEISRGLSSCGITIVSGMAQGIDSLAHWGAIEGKSKTLAVVGCGADKCYPSSNKHLYKTIVEEGHGAIISEYFPGTAPEKWRFPARNRIISGLCEALVVIEAGETSGALITANLAFDQSREVFAVPGRVDSAMSQGTNNLIAKNKAHLIRNHEDVLKEMQWVVTQTPQEVPTVVELYGREKDVFELISTEPIHFDVLCQLTGMPAGEMSATLTMLELAGIVERHPGDWYSRQHNITLSTS